MVYDIRYISKYVNENGWCGAWLLFNGNNPIMAERLKERLIPRAKPHVGYLAKTEKKDHTLKIYDKVMNLKDTIEYHGRKK